MGEEGVKAETNASPSVHPSPPTPDVLPEDGTPACTSYIFIILLSIQAPPLTHLPLFQLSSVL